ncbi:hypothetical protein HDU91_005793 [Kappamyces sp. JEL0680]|nr:hypothetical protein HDU91_005793 [Kappamyces sp. JEL0680]
MLPDAFKRHYFGYEEALLDSLAFRSGVCKFMEEMEDTQRWFDTIAKSFKSYADDCARYNDSVSQLGKRLSSRKFPALIDPGVMTTLSESMNTLATIQMKSLESVQDKMNVFPHITALVKDVRDARRVMDRAMERYDSSLSKQVASSKTRDATMYHEQCCIVADTKKQYLLTALEFVYKVTILKDYIDLVLSDKMFSSLGGIGAHFSESVDILNGLIAAAKVYHIPEVTSPEILLSTYTKFKEPLESKGKGEKQGYLFLKKPDQKWSRRYFTLKNRTLIWSSTSRVTSAMFDCTPIDLTGCSTKLNTTEDRKFCFDLMVPLMDPIVLQGENEKDMKSWMEWLDTAASSPREEDFGEIIREESENALELSVNVEVISSPVANDIPMSETPLAYVDTLMQKKNEELHHLLKSVPSSDYVLDVFSAALQKEVLVQGKCYLTQNRLCFYSNILGFVNIVIVHLHEIRDIQKRPGTLQTSLVVTTQNDSLEHVFKLYGKPERAFNILTAIWRNAVSEKDLLTYCNSLLKDGKPTSERLEQSSIAIDPPTEEVGCGCKEHLDKMEYSSVLNTSAKDKKEGAWSDELLPCKQIDYTVPVNNPMIKLKEIEVKETLSFLKRAEYLCYVLERKSATPQVPFGDCFTTVTRYCITWVSTDSCKLEISIGICFLKSTMMKPMIKTNALKGLADSLGPLFSRLEESLSKLDGDGEVESRGSLWSLPAEVSAPAGPVACECPKHLEKIDVDVTIGSSAKAVYEMLFGSTAAVFWAEIDKSRGEFNRKESAWTNDTKTCSYMMTLDNPLLKTKEFEVKSTLAIVKKAEYLSYVVEVTSCTPEVPYGDCFTTETRYCVTWVSSGSCRVVISNGVTFSKTTMMKSLIKSNASKGQLEKSNQVVALLQAKSEKKPADTAKEKSTVSARAGSVRARESKMQSGPFTWSSLAIFVAAFITGLFASYFYLSTASTAMPAKINWKKELGLSRTSYHSMQQFIDSHLVLDEANIATRIHTPFVSDDHSATHEKLLRVLAHIQTTKRDIELMTSEIHAMEKHLVWNMYLEWRAAELAQCMTLVNATSRHCTSAMLDAL